MKRTLKDILGIDINKLRSTKLSKLESEKLIKEVSDHRNEILSRTNIRIG